MFDKFKSRINAAFLVGSIVLPRLAARAKDNASSHGVTGVIMAMIVIVVGLALTPTVLSFISTVTTNATYKTNFPSVVSIASVIGVIFIIVVLVAGVMHIGGRGR